MVTGTTKKTLRHRIAEFVQQRKDLDKTSLVSFVQEVVEKQEKAVFTVHRDEASGEVDCVCLGDLCTEHNVPTEQTLKCKRLHWLFVGEAQGEDSETDKDD